MQIRSWQWLADWADVFSRKFGLILESVSWELTTVPRKHSGETDDSRPRLADVRTALPQ